MGVGRPGASSGRDDADDDIIGVGGNDVDTVKFGLLEHLAAGSTLETRVNKFPILAVVDDATDAVAALIPNSDIPDEEPVVSNKFLSIILLAARLDRSTTYRAVLDAISVGTSEPWATTLPP